MHAEGLGIDKEDITFVCEYSSKKVLNEIYHLSLLKKIKILTSYFYFLEDVRYQRKKVSFVSKLKFTILI